MSPPKPRYKGPMYFSVWGWDFTVNGTRIGVHGFCLQECQELL